MPPISDPDRRIRWIQGTVAAMVLSASVGLFVFISGEPWGPRWNLKPALAAGATTTAVIFWVIFPILYFCHVRKSRATLEYQDRLRRDEESLRRRPTR